MALDGVEASSAISKNKSLFERLLGDSFAILPKPIKQLHDRRKHKFFAGQCRIARGVGWFVSILAWVASLPQPGENLPVHISLSSDGCTETWSRNFNGQPMCSRLRDRNGYLEERLGPARFKFSLHANHQALVWTFVGVSVLDLPLPLAWFNVLAKESVEAGRYTFDVRVEMLLIGLLIHYQGYLNVESEGQGCCI